MAGKDTHEAKPKELIASKKWNDLLADLPFLADDQTWTGTQTFDQNDNAITLDIDSEATTADIINISADKLTTGIVFDVPDLDALTTGKAINIVSNSSSTSTRTLLKIHSNNPLASGSTIAEFLNDGGGQALINYPQPSNQILGFLLSRPSIQQGATYNGNAFSPSSESPFEKGIVQVFKGFYDTYNDLTGIDLRYSTYDGTNALETAYNEHVLEGVCTTDTASKLTQATANFVAFDAAVPATGNQTYIKVGDYVINTHGASSTKFATARVTAIDSTTVLSLSSDALADGDEDFIIVRGSTVHLPGPAKIVNDGVGGFKTLLWDGIASTLAVTGSGFQVDLAWIKNREQTDDHVWFDIIRGVTNHIESNNTSAQTTDANSLSVFGSDGLTVVSSAIVNASGEKYVGWCMECNTDVTEVGGGTGGGGNSITPTTEKINVNTGMSIILYEGDTTSGSRVGHNLQDKDGARAPQFGIFKSIDGVTNWGCYHHKLHTEQLPGADPGDAFLEFNLTAALSNAASAFNDVPASTTFVSLGSGTTTNAAQTMIAYLFCEIPGYSKFGCFEGSGAGDHVITGLGFKPQWLMIKSIDSTSSWFIFDVARGKNVGGGNKHLIAEGTAGDVTTGLLVSLEDDGSTIHITTDPNIAETYVYAAFGAKGAAQALDLISDEVTADVTPTDAHCYGLWDLNSSATLGTDLKLYVSRVTGADAQTVGTATHWTQATLYKIEDIDGDIDLVYGTADVAAAQNSGTALTYRWVTSSTYRAECHGTFMGYK